MNLPKQSAPIDRTLSTASASPENGVEASGIGDILKTVASAALPLIGGLI